MPPPRCGRNKSKVAPDDVCFLDWQATAGEVNDRMITKFWLFAWVASVAFFVADETVLSQTVPFQLQDNLVRMEGSVNGQPVNTVLDSGTGSIVVGRAVATRLGLHEGEASGVSAGGGEKKEPLYPVILDKLEAGPIKLTQVHGMTANLESLAATAGFPIDVLLGL